MASTHGDLLLNAIDNLRGYRCAEQGPFQAHVDAVWTKAITVTEQLEGAVDLLREARSWVDQGAFDGNRQALALRERIDAAFPDLRGR